MWLFCTTISGSFVSNSTNGTIVSTTSTPCSDFDRSIFGYDSIASVSAGISPVTWRSCLNDSCESRFSC